MDLAGESESFNGRFPSSPIRVAEDRLGIVTSVSGSLELEISYELQKLFARVVESTESGRRIVVDLSKVVYISSTGVGALISTVVDAKKRGVGIVFRSVPRKIASVLDVLGLTDFFPCEDEES